MPLRGRGRGTSVVCPARVARVAVAGPAARRADSQVDVTEASDGPTREGRGPSAAVRRPELWGNCQVRTAVPRHLSADGVDRRGVGDRGGAPLGDDDRGDDDRHRDHRDGDPQAGVGARRRPRSATMAGAISSETRFITLISGLIAGPAVSLNGSPTVSPMMVASCAARALAAVVAVLDQLLGVVPGTTGVGQEHRHQGAGARSRRPGSRPAAPTPRPKPTAIGASTASRPGVTSSRSESLVTMSTTLPYSGRAGALHDPGDLAELAAHLVDHRAGGPGHGVDRQAGEQEHHRRAEEHADQDVRVEHDEVERAGAGRVVDARRLPQRCR